MRFHRRCGDRVTLLNENSTAVRNFVEFNHGLILSCEPLKDDVMFEVCIDRKVNVWNGSLEIGVTTLDPEFVELPATATKLRNTAWIMSGSSIVKDGVTLVNSYGPELDTLREGDCVGVMRTSKGELMFYVNSRCLGIAARDMPPRLFAVIDLYGQCVQVSIMRATDMRPIMETSVDQIEEDPNNDDTLTSSEMEGAGLPPEPYPKEIQTICIPMTSEGACALVVPDQLRFHPRCGILVKLSANNKSAERARPLDDYNNGVVMTHRPLYNNELFEIRIDRLVDKWSGSIEVGVTTHNPATIRFPSTMTNMDTGTIMMSGCKVLLNGHGTCMEYGNFNLDDLREGDTVGMMRKSNGKLHYFINGVDQGVATDKVDQQVWGVVDLYGMTVKVSIVDPCEDLDSNINNPPLMVASPDSPAPSRFRPQIDEDSLLFHTLRDSNVIVINDGKTAHRLNAFKYFNNGIVMTNRTLRTNELFQVRIDLVIPKWAGSIEIGVTQHSSNDIQFPFKMSNAKSGTWAVTGEDVIRDGVIIIPQYVRNLNRLVEGETVGVLRNDLGILHVYINGADQGPAAFNVPENVYGIIDLYGRAAQATIVDNYSPPPLYSPESPLSTESNATIFPEMCFHRVHGRNARLSRNRLTAWRATVYSEFNDAVLFSSRPLRECDMFELRIDKMVDCWIGSLEIGVTAIRPDDFEASGGVGAVAGTATDLNWDTYILSGAAMMKDGECVRSGYPLDLDTLTVGSRVGMMWHADRSLHYYLDGMDMGKAWYVPHLNIYAVVDLYGQCTQVTILQNEERAFNYNGCSNSDNSILSNSRAMSSPPPPYWSFSEYCGDNVCLMHDYSIAKRITTDPMAGLVFSSAHLAIGEIFEIKIAECKSGYAGTFRMGITDINILNAHVNRSLPPSVACLPHYTAYIDGRSMKYSKPGSREQEIMSFVPSFEWLRTGDRVGLKKTSDSKVLVYYNSEELDLAFENVPDKVYVVMELFGHVTKIQAVNQGNVVVTAGILQQTLQNDVFLKSNTAQPNNVYTENIDGLFEANLTNLANICVLSGESADGSIDGLGGDPSIDPSGRSSVDPSGAPSIVPSPSPSPTSPKPNAPPDSPPNSETLDEEPMEQISQELEPVPKDPEACEENSSADKPKEGESAMEIRRRRNNLPYTFYYIHGDNIRLCSSDTVAVRYKGYQEGIAVVSQPVRRGHNFRFRVDKLDHEWCGTAGIGAVGVLPIELPMSAIHLDTPCWILTSDLHNDNGVFLLVLYKTQVRSCVEYCSHLIDGSAKYQLSALESVEGRAKKIIGDKDLTNARLESLEHRRKVASLSIFYRIHFGECAEELHNLVPPSPFYHRTTSSTTVSLHGRHTTFTHTISIMGMALDNLVEQSVLTLHFRFNSELVLEIDGKIIGAIGVVPRRFSHIFPTIDLYGKIAQVSVLLHPYVVTSGASLDLPIITENLCEDEFADQEIFDTDKDPTQAIEHTAPPLELSRPKKKPKAYSQDNLIEDHLPPIIIEAGPSTLPDPIPDTSTSNPIPSETKTKEIRCRKQYPNRTSLHHSLILTDNVLPTNNNEMVNRCIQKSHSTHSFCQIPDENETKGLRHTFSVGSHVGSDADRVHEQFYDTNIRHNDRYPEASDVDNLDNELMDGLTMEPGNLPDLTEEQSSSIDESTRRDDFWSDSLSVENLNYLNRILCLDQEGIEGQSLESEWEASGEGCEHLHLVLKYWNYLVLPYPELRQAVSWGQVKCHCSNCQPDAIPPLAGWVRIERIDGVGAAQRAFWHVVRSTLGMAQVASGERGNVRRPRCLTSAPSTSPSLADIWLDEEGKPHHTVLAIEIDVEGSEAEHDRLLAFLIYLKPSITFADEDHPPSLDE